MVIFELRHEIEAELESIQIITNGTIKRRKNQPKERGLIIKCSVRPHSTFPHRPKSNSLIITFGTTEIQKKEIPNKLNANPNGSFGIGIMLILLAL